MSYFILFLTFMMVKTYQCAIHRVQKQGMATLEMRRIPDATRIAENWNK
jgi:hypothetical protein